MILLDSKEAGKYRGFLQLKMICGAYPQEILACPKCPNYYHQYKHHEVYDEI